MRNTLKIILLLLVNAWQVNAQGLPVPNSIGNSHPRIFGKEMIVQNVKQLANEKPWAQNIIDNTKKKLDPYLIFYKKDKTWLVSRLQMNWKTKANQVYINGGTFSRAEGMAPVPTVKFPGTRNHITEYKQPALEDIKPYMDDARGLYLERRDNVGAWEWTGISKTGKIVESVNRQILGLSRDAAFLYWYTGDKNYANFAYDVLDTYLMGIYYLKEPIDLSHGHHQTLVGYTSFEVIQEHILGEISQSYDFLYNYIKTEHPDKIAIYGATLQKWADQIIKNGVSFNNWNLLEALHISKIAMVLDDNSNYLNGKGGIYYLDQIMNKTSTRQWSMNKLIDYGYDVKTGIWNESPGYSQNVLNDFVHFAEFYDRNFDIDLLKDIPVLGLATKSFVQYLYPNKNMVAFGDGHYKKMSSEAIMYMIENAHKYGKKEEELYFTKILKTIFEKDLYSGKFSGKQLEDLFSKEPVKIREDVEVTNLSELLYPLFYAPNTSWLTQRQIGGEKELMISQIGSLGNHMHSNGIAMELYGYGLPLAPEMGHGSSYFSIEYGEYYTQFPAHNTVAVNGRSKYPEMKSNHAFTTNSYYPESGNKAGNFKGLTFSDVSFLEPETNSNQRRVMGILNNENGAAYYIDIFRSKQNTGNNIKHDYFYHNLGQSFSLVDEQNTPLQLNPTSKLAFGDGDLMAYDYMWDKKSIETSQNFKGQFNLKMEDKTVSMNIWMKGAENREIFSVLSPASTALSHVDFLSKDLSILPIPTMVVRQNGEAWNKPFVAIYEPALNSNTAIHSVDYFGKDELVGIQVNSKNGQEDFIFSNTQSNISSQYKGMQLVGSYGVIAKDRGKLKSFFLADGTLIENNEYSLKATENTTAAFTFEENNWGYMSKSPVELQIPMMAKKDKIKLVLDNGQLEIEGEIKKIDKKEVLIFLLPANGKYTKVMFKKS